MTSAITGPIKEDVSSVEAPVRIRGYSVSVQLWSIKCVFYCGYTIFYLCIFLILTAIYHALALNVSSVVINVT